MINIQHRHKTANDAEVMILAVRGDVIYGIVAPYHGQWAASWDVHTGASREHPGSWDLVDLQKPPIPESVYLALDPKGVARDAYLECPNNSVLAWLWKLDTTGYAGSIRTPRDIEAANRAGYRLVERKLAP